MSSGTGSHRRSLWLLSLLVAFFAGAVLLPAASQAAPKHFLKIYKVENQVDINGGGHAHVHTYCNPGDYAIDGMWRVDNVDQENPQIGIFGDMTDVSVERSYSDLTQGGDGAKWHFEISNNADGRAQLKIFAVCLGGKTAENSHQHDINIRPLVTTGFFPGGDFSSASLACNPWEVAVGPGFKTLVGGKVWQKSSYPGNPLSSSWNWNFSVSDPTSMELSVLCLNRKTASNFGHRHRLRIYLRPGYWPLGAHDIKKNSVQEKVIGCKDGFKAGVGGLGIAPWNHGWVHFLGMDPRPKKRAYKFWNKDPFNDLPVYLATICIGIRTGNAT